MVGLPLWYTTGQDDTLLQEISDQVNSFSRARGQALPALSRNTFGQPPPKNRTLLLPKIACAAFTAPGSDVSPAEILGELISAGPNQPGRVESLPITVKRHANGTPDRRAKRTPRLAFEGLVQVANRRAPRARVARFNGAGGAGAWEVPVCPPGQAGHGWRNAALLAWRSDAVFEAPAFVAGFDNVAMMGQPVEKCSGHLGIAEHARPFAKGKVGSDDD